MHTPTVFGLSGRTRAPGAAAALAFSLAAVKPAVRAEQVGQQSSGARGSRAGRTGADGFGQLKPGDDVARAMTWRRLHCDM